MSLVPRSQERPFLIELLTEGKARQPLLALIALFVGVIGGLAVVMLPSPLLGFIVVAGLIVAGVMLTSPLFSLVSAIAIICLLPFGVIPVRVGLTFTFLEATLLALSVVWLLRFSVHRDRQDAKYITSPLDGAILLLIGLSLFALILSWKTSGTSDIIHNYFKFILSILVFFPVINLVRTQRIMDMLVKAIMVLGSLAAFIGVGLYALSRPLQERLLVSLGRVGYPTDGRVLRFHEDDPSQAQRATGTSVDPNSYGGMLVLIIALLLTQLFAPKPLLKRWLIVLMLGVSGAALALTYGRGAQVGAVALAVLISFKYRRILLYALPAIVIGIAVLPSTFLWERLMQGFAFQDEASKLRLEEYQNALNIIWRYPWFGIGFGPAPDPDLQAGVSSIYFTIAERTGLVGLAAFLFLVILYFIYIGSHFGKLRTERQKANLLGLMAGVIGALAVGVVDHYFFNPEFSHMAALLWIFIGLSVAQIKIGQAEEEASP
ncbi:MAG TPA: O-antigen ligase family protein [Chloroflexia bacterium]|nr:O-antigen ligase family protein [Chloroflexia bacterium]